jgi:hypothetical protein
MNKVGILCEKDNAMLHEFSKRALKRVTGQALSSLSLPFVSSYMEANVMKEADKDRIVIENASAVYQAGKQSVDLDVDAVFENTKTVDRAFEGIRKQRIRCLSTAVHDLLGSWEDAAGFEDAVRRAFTRQRFKDVMTEVLRLYNLETKMLSGSIKFFHPFSSAINFLAEAVFTAMEEASAGLVDECAGKIYGGERHHV